MIFDCSIVLFNNEFIRQYVHWFPGMKCMTINVCFIADFYSGINASCFTSFCGPFYRAVRLFFINLWSQTWLIDQLSMYIFKQLVLRFSFLLICALPLLALHSVVLFVVYCFMLFVYSFCEGDMCSYYCFLISAHSQGDICFCPPNVYSCKSRWEENWKPHLDKVIYMFAINSC